LKLSREKTKYVETVATEALDDFEKVSTAAKQNLGIPPVHATSTFPNINTLTATKAVIGSSTYDGPVPLPCDDDGSSTQFRVVPLFNRGIEGVHIDMYDFSDAHQNNNSTEDF